MDFENAVLNYVLAVFFLVAGVIGVLLTVLFIISGHVLPEGLITSLVTAGFFALYGFIKRKK